MKILLALLFSLNSFAGVEAACQMKLLKFGIDQLDKEFHKMQENIWLISEVDFNYGVENMPQIVLLAKPAIYNNGYPCIIKVAADEGSKTKGCPEYKLHRIWTNCGGAE